MISCCCLLLSLPGRVHNIWFCIDKFTHIFRLLKPTKDNSFPLQLCLKWRDSTNCLARSAGTEDLLYKLRLFLTMIYQFNWISNEPWVVVFLLLILFSFFLFCFSLIILMKQMKVNFENWLWILFLVFDAAIIT